MVLSADDNVGRGQSRLGTGFTNSVKLFTLRESVRNVNRLPRLARLL